MVAHILFPDVDFAVAVKKGVAGCFGNSGQSCNAPTRMFVPRDRQEEAADYAKKAAETHDGVVSLAGLLVQHDIVDVAKLFASLIVNVGAIDLTRCDQAASGVGWIVDCRHEYHLSGWSAVPIRA